MAQYPNLYNVELTKGPAVVQLQQMFLGDVKANRIGAIVTENGEAVTLGGTCSGTAILANGGTVSISGTVSGNTCYIDLPSGVYAVEGPVSIFLNNVSGENTTTLVAAFGNVCKTQTGTVIDPGTVIPSVSALIDAIDAAVASIPADYTALLAAVAPTFSSSTAYTAGRYVWYSGNLYRFTADHAAGTWAGTDAVQVVVTNEIIDLKSATDNLYGITTYDVVYPNSGYINVSGDIVPNANFYYSDFIKVKFFNRNVNIYWHQIVATFTFYDANKNYLNEYVKTDSGAGMAEAAITIPNDAVYMRVCTDPTYANEVYAGVDVKEENSNVEAEIEELRNTINGTAIPYGNNNERETPFATSFNNFTATPCKKAEKSGKVTSLYVKSYTSGMAKIYVGEVDQFYLFIPRESFDIELAEGEQTIDVSDKNIYINEGENVLIKFIGKVPFQAYPGEPEGDDSFYYSSGGTMQLQVFGAQNAAVFGFGYVIVSSQDYSQDKQIETNTKDIENAQNDISYLQSNFNVVSDRNGNKYKMIVQNGSISLLAMDFKNVLCVGNSYTTHPTTEDTETDYRNNLWWGHWSMAATTSLTAWTKLLQNALRQKHNDAIVTPVFGRRYETNPNTYTLDNDSTFTYWTGSAWQGLKPHVSDFGNVDAIVFFLGANYSGNDWYTLYKAMVEKFLTWFPNATLFCCSCAANAMEAKDTAIQTVANEELATYISMVGINGKNKIGAYVNGDDGTLHQIDNQAVANHFGDYGEYLILDRLCNAMGYVNNAELYNLSISAVSGVTLTLVANKSVSDAVVSVFATVESGTTLSAITVTDSNNNNITVTDHGSTDYGRVFTFVMPSSDVTITGVTA